MAHQCWAALVVDDAGYDTTFWAQFGLSMLVEATSNETTKRILVDTGLSAEPLLHNMQILGIDPKSIDFIFLSHCHYDHTGGLVSFLEKTNKGFTVIAHPSILRPCYTLKPSLRYIGIVDRNCREIIEKNGGNLFLTRDPIELMPGVLSTGEVERKTSFEPRENTFILEDGHLVPDPEADDMSLIVNVKGSGLVILTGCGHAGIVNIMRQSKKITGIKNIISVIGGLHLRIASEERLNKTVEELAVVPSICVGHCTGFKAMKAISERLGDDFSLLQCGKVLEFSGSEEMNSKWQT